MCFIHSSSTT